MILATLFVNPLDISSTSMVFMMIPLCMAVAIVYKTIRVDHIRQGPLQILLLMAYMASGLTALGAALWIIQEIAL